jgi:hypothetical protein
MASRGETQRRVLALRKFVKGIVDPPAACQRVVEQQLMRTSRILLTRMSAAERAQLDLGVHPSWAIAAVVLRAYEGLEIDSLLPGPGPASASASGSPTAASSSTTPGSVVFPSTSPKVVLTPGELKQKCRNRWLTLHRRELEAEALLAGKKADWRRVGSKKFEALGRNHPEVEELASSLLEGGVHLRCHDSSSGRFTLKDEEPAAVLSTTEVVMRPGKAPGRKRRHAACRSLLSDLEAAASSAPTLARGWLRRVVAKSWSKLALGDSRIPKLKLRNPREYVRRGAVFKNLKHGRKPGSCKLTDAQIKLKLKPGLAPSCRYSLRHEDTFMVMGGSRRDLHTTYVDGLSYSRFCERLSSNKLCIQPATQAQDLCDYCVGWFDEKLKPRLSRYRT